MIDDANLLIIGSNGQLGKALQQQYPAARAVDSGELDITSPEEVNQFDWTGVRTVLNAAAYTNVDGAETPDGRKAAWAVNATGVANLARAAARHDITLVHISTDYVFDGTQQTHSETEALSPLSVYGATKAAGDIAASLAPKHYILRTSWVIGEGKNFVQTMAGLAEKDISPTVVADQIGRLTFTGTLVEAIHHLLTKGCAYGIYNVSDSGEPASWADVTRTIFENLGRSDLTVTDTTTAEYFESKPEAAPRPLNSTLDLSKIEATGYSPRDWHENLRSYLNKENQIL